MPTLDEEVQSLRQQVAEVTEKSRNRKAKISELEASVADLQTKLTTSETALRTLSIDEPLQRLAGELSDDPELFLMLFAKEFSVDRRDGKLVILNAATGEPVKTAKKEDVPFEWKAVADYVTSKGSKHSKSFAKIVYTTKATGSGAEGGKQNSAPGDLLRQDKKEEARQQSQFGLR